MTTSADSPQTSKPNWKDLATGYLNRRGNQETLLGLLGLNNFRRASHEHHSNREAESKWARKAVWGNDGSSEADDGMGDLIGGDQKIEYHYHYPEPPAKAESAIPATSTAGTLAKLAVGAGLIAAGAGIPYGASMIADALKNQEPSTVTVEQPPATTVEVPDSDYELMLGEPE